jgi:hypothetical protein
MNHRSGTSDVIYGLGLIGALIYFIQNATSFWEVITGIFKAFFVASVFDSSRPTITENMNKQFLKDAFIWGIILWLIGYVLGIILFMVVPQSILGWVIMPVGVALTLWVLFKKIRGNTLQNYLWLAVIWTLLAIVLDYFYW